MANLEGVLPLEELREDASVDTKLEAELEPSREKSIVLADSKALVSIKVDKDGEVINGTFADGRIISRNKDGSWTIDAPGGNSMKVVNLKFDSSRGTIEYSPAAAQGMHVAEMADGSKTITEENHRSITTDKENRIVHITESNGTQWQVEKVDRESTGRDIYRFKQEGSQSPPWTGSLERQSDGRIVIQTDKYLVGTLDDHSQQLFDKKSGRCVERLWPDGSSVKFDSNGMVNETRDTAGNVRNYRFVPVSGGFELQEVRVNGKVAETLDSKGQLREIKAGAAVGRNSTIPDSELGDSVSYDFSKNITRTIKHPNADQTISATSTSLDGQTKTVLLDQQGNELIPEEKAQPGADTQKGQPGEGPKDEDKQEKPPEAEKGKPKEQGDKPESGEPDINTEGHFNHDGDRVTVNTNKKTGETETIVESPYGATRIFRTDAKGNLSFVQDESGATWTPTENGWTSSKGHHLDKLSVGADGQMVGVEGDIKHVTYLDGTRFHYNKDQLASVEFPGGGARVLQYDEKTHKITGFQDTDELGRPLRNITLPAGDYSVAGKGEIIRKDTKPEEPQIVYGQNGKLELKDGQPVRFSGWDGSRREFELKDGHVAGFKDFDSQGKERKSFTVPEDFDRYNGGVLVDRHSGDLILRNPDFSNAIYKAEGGLVKTDTTGRVTSVTHPDSSVYSFSYHGKDSALNAVTIERPGQPSVTWFGDNSTRNWTSSNGKHFNGTYQIKADGGFVRTDERRDTQSIVRPSGAIDHHQMLDKKIVTYRTDLNNNLTEFTRENGSKVQVEYDSGKPKSCTLSDKLGGQTVYEATGDGKWVLKGDANRSPIEIKFVPERQQVIITSERTVDDRQRQEKHGQKVVTVDYASGERETQVIFGNQVESRIYYNDGARVGYVQQNGGVAFEYDKDGQTNKISFYTADGKPNGYAARQVDANGKCTDKWIDNNGKTFFEGKIEVDHKTGDYAYVFNGFRTIYRADGLGTCDVVNDSKQDHVERDDQQRIWVSGSADGTARRFTYPGNDKRPSEFIETQVVNGQVVTNRFVRSGDTDVWIDQASRKSFIIKMDEQLKVTSTAEAAYCKQEGKYWHVKNKVTGDEAWYQGGVEVRRKDAQGESVRNPYGGWTRDNHILQWKEVAGDGVQGNNAEERARRCADLDKRAVGLLTRYATRNGDVNFKAHGRMLTEIAESQDLTENEKMYLYDCIVKYEFEGLDDNGLKTRDTRFRLVGDDMPDDVRSTKGPNVIRHQVLRAPLTQDGYHGEIAFDKRSTGVGFHEGVKALRSDPLDPTIDQGDYNASVRQIGAIRQYRAVGFKGYADGWNREFARK